MMLMRRWYARHSTLVSLVIILALLCVPLLADPRPAHASTVTVNSASDGGPGNCTSTCTLRDAIAVAIPGDTITFDPAVFSVPQTIALAGSTLTIAKDLTIAGPGPNLVTVDGANAFTVFTVVSG